MASADVLALDDGARDEGDGGARAVETRGPLVDPAVEPSGGDRAAAELGRAHEVEQQRAVGRSALDGDGGAREGVGEAREGLVAGGARDDELREHGVELGGNGPARLEAGVDADARPVREIEAVQATGAGREVVLRVFGVEAHLDGVPTRRGSALDAGAHGDVDLRADEVEAGGALGDGVLHLEAGVHFEEDEALAVGRDEKLRRACVDVPARAGDRDGAAAHAIERGGREQRRGAFLDDLLVAALHGAVARSDGVHVAVGVGEHLHLDVARLGEQRLDEQ